MTRTVRALALLAASFFLSSAMIAQEQEGSDRKKDKDSIELVVSGCLKGRALQAEEVHPVRNDEATVVQARTFRVNGERPIMDEVKRQNNRYVEVTGRVKRSSLTAAGPGITVGGARITVTPGTMGDPSRAPQTAPNAGVVPIEATAVRMVSESCSFK